MTAIVEKTDDYVLRISDSGRGLYRADHDNALLVSTRKVTVHTRITITCGVGVVACGILMFVDSIVRNS